MPRFDLYSKRKNDAAKAGQSDVYNYDFVTSNFRIQLCNIANYLFGDDRQSNRVAYYNNPHWAWISKTYSHEIGISPIGGTDHKASTAREFYKSCNHEMALDLTEVIVFRINHLDGSKIEEINYRLREAGMGYQFEAGRLTRVDSQLVHQEVVKPALALLSHPGFPGVEEEFLNAHAHYRAGQNKEAVSMAANALESTFKAVFDSKGWAYPTGSGISDLAKVAKSNGLWPEYLDKSLDQLLATLQSGLPKIRDNDASHGQGSNPKEVPAYLAAYALHLAASKIVFIVSAANAKV